MVPLLLVAGGCASDEVVPPRAGPTAAGPESLSTPSQEFVQCGRDKAFLQESIRQKELATDALNASDGSRAAFRKYAVAMDGIHRGVASRRFGDVLGKEARKVTRAMSMISEGTYRTLAATSDEAFDAGDAFAERGEHAFDLFRGRVIWFECKVDP